MKQLITLLSVLILLRLCFGFWYGFQAASVEIITGSALLVPIIILFWLSYELYESG